MRLPSGFSRFFVPFIRPSKPQNFFRPFNLPLIFRPFVRPFINHPVVRAFIQPVLRLMPRPDQQPLTLDRHHPTRNLDKPAERTRGGQDPTLRPDDPYVSHVNKPAFDEQQSVKQLTQNVPKWQDRNRNNLTEISYSFYNSGFNEAQKREARRSMESWADVANLEFQENGGAAEGQLTFGISPFIATAQGTYPTSNRHGGGETLYNPGMVKRVVMTHEIGHALGLRHPGNYDGNASENQRVYAQDSTAHTVMSYFGDRSSGKQLGAKPKAPMMDDISAMQNKYGANHRTRREDNTYGFNSNTRRDYYSLDSAEDRFIACIWDGAGNDTLDFSGYRSNQILNLKAGAFSDVGGLQGNLSIARGCTIENAIGGSGHDALIGNAADNRLTGGGGADALRGGDGADTFIYNHASDSTPVQPDTLMDFTSGTDKIDVSGALQQANTPALIFTSTFSGKAGESVLAYDEQTGRGSVSIDLTGDGHADLLINTHGRVNPEDLVQAKPGAPLQHSSYRPREPWLQKSVIATGSKGIPYLEQQAVRIEPVACLAGVARPPH